MHASLYLHIPFCDSKCGYCAFNSLANKNHLKTAYMQALHSQLLFKLQSFENLKITSLYIGGGTPSVLKAELYEPIFNAITPYLQSHAEVSIEANPNSLNYEWICTLKDFGVNRVSLGVQSFFPQKLQFLERNHQNSSTFEAINSLKRANIQKISIDLIYGTPLCNETLLQKEVQEAVSLGTSHISAYHLSIDEGSAFFKQKKKELSGEFAGFASMGHFVKTLLEKEGFLQYEISNFAKNSHFSYHNLSYWEQKPYIGVGAGAVGCIHNQRFYPQTKLENYIQNPLKEEIENLSEEDLELEGLFLGLRTSFGVSLDKIKNTKKLQILLKEKKVKEEEGKIIANDLFLGDEIALFLSE
ncbi:coproporphyrinogen III oxidase [Helicobacter valdiviensis]|uniref:Heme chaperone HemW n=1 Tax=Helicobacter valdiviensis TaxID=1458358 RepID=A0A2W6NEW2_9HELI|nr:radical SAM family heme chaperone HemW [Helicobacter valdiviensis]PZT47530.1 coproporphyrinogen III oxidase [Helicobacter valdiviensis]